MYNRRIQYFVSAVFVKVNRITVKWIFMQRILYFFNSVPENIAWYTTINEESGNGNNFAVSDNSS